MTKSNLTISQKEFDELQQQISAQVSKAIENDKSLVEKTDGFDFHELSSDITQSITDQVYRRLQPGLSRHYLKKVTSGNNKSARNDLLVTNISRQVEERLNVKLVDIVADKIEKRVARELDEQYHPPEGSNEEKIDNLIRGSRKFILPGYFAVCFVLFILGLLVCYEAIIMGVQFYDMLLFKVKPPSNFDQLSFSESAFISRFFLNQIVASVLSILDLLLLAALVVMVLIGGFENTIGRLGMMHDSPTWFGKLDITELKLKVSSSIVIISSIHLLTFFMLLNVTRAAPVAAQACLDKGKDDAKCIEEGAVVVDRLMKQFGTSVYDFEALKWTAIVHGVFVFSALALAYMAKIQHGTKNTVS
jgi:uncharacterized membrane protein YqhA